MYRRQFSDVRVQLLRAKDAHLIIDKQLTEVNGKISEVDGEISILRVGYDMLIYRYSYLDCSSTAHVQSRLVERTNAYDVKADEIKAQRKKVDTERIRVEGLKRQAEEIETTCKVCI